MQKGVPRFFKINPLLVQAFVTVVKNPAGLTQFIGDCQGPVPATACPLERNRGWLRYLGLCHLHGISGQPGFCRHLEGETSDGRSLNFTVSHSIVQQNKIKKLPIFL